MPRGWLPSAGTQHMACGERFDAVRLRSFTGVLLARRLGRHGGAVIEDRTGTDGLGREVWRLVWLVPPRTMRGLRLPGVDVLGADDTVTIPGLAADPPVWWARPPDARRPVLTDPELLRRTLASLILPGEAARV